MHESSEYMVLMGYVVFDDDGVPDEKDHFRVIGPTGLEEAKQWKTILLERDDVITASVVRYGGDILEMEAQLDRR